MSTIKLEIEISAENVQYVAELLVKIAGTSGKVAKMEVIDTEEVKAPSPAKTPTPRPSRAKPKPEPVIEEEDDDFADDDEEAITADDIRALQATKIDKNRDSLKAHYKKLGATGLKDLAPENFQKMFDFLSKLK